MLANLNLELYTEDVQKKWLLVVSFFILVLVAAVTGLLYQKKLISRIQAPNPAIYGTFIISSDLPNVYLHCQIQSEEINSEADMLGPELVILRAVPCIYQGASGEDKSVSVPLAYYNSKLNQFYSLNSAVNDLGMPGVGYIDNKINDLVMNPTKNPIVSLEANGDLTRDNPKIAKFITNTNSILDPNWAKLFAQTDNNKYLPVTKSGKKVFFALNWTYIQK